MRQTKLTWGFFQIEIIRTSEETIEKAMQWLLGRTRQLRNLVVIQIPELIASLAIIKSSFLSGRQTLGVHGNDKKVLFLSFGDMYHRN